MPDHTHRHLFDSIKLLFAVVTVVLVSNVLILYLVIACSKYNIADGMRQMFDPFETVARAQHICPCCERPFSAEEEDDFVKKVGIAHSLL